MLFIHHSIFIAKELTDLSLYQKFDLTNILRIISVDAERKLADKKTVNYHIIAGLKGNRISNMDALKKLNRSKRSHLYNQLFPNESLRSLHRWDPLTTLPNSYTSKRINY